MCTLAWRQQQDQLWVCFNRDEQRSRPAAEPPSLDEIDGSPCIFARDPEGGGTWFIASSKGFVVALLNNYAASREVLEKGRRSRGTLVLSLSTADSISNARDQMDKLTAADYSPFYLFLLSSTQAHAWSWDGGALQSLSPDEPYWTSSSFRPEEVQSYRRQVLEALSKQHLDNASIAKEFRRFDQGAPEFGLTMDREKTRTMSQIELTMNSTGIEFSYHARDPHGTGYLSPSTVSWPAGESS
ncbi:MAG: NRDE family protein [Puniceicoccaceae bacterium]